MVVLEGPPLVHGLAVIPGRQLQVAVVRYWYLPSQRLLPPATRLTAGGEFRAGVEAATGG